MKRFMAVFMLLGLVVLTACGRSAKGGLTAADVAGTWEKDMSDGVKTMTLGEDMTYTETIVVTTPTTIQTTTNGTYSLDGDTIEINFEDYGMTSEYKVTLTEDTLTLDNGQSQQVFKRK